MIQEMGAKNLAAYLNAGRDIDLLFCEKMYPHFPNSGADDGVAKENIFAVIF
jgi:hypothetical protein